MLHTMCEEPFDMSPAQLAGFDALENHPGVHSVVFTGQDLLSRVVTAEVHGHLTDVTFVQLTASGKMRIEP